jgi:hypothetical protein
MKRRRFLAAAGVSLGVAGCLSRESEPGGTNPGTDTPTAGDTDETATKTPGETPGSGGTPPSDGFELGETIGDVNPHEFRVSNDGDVSRTVDLRITDAETDGTLLDQSYTLPAKGNIAGLLRGPAEYDVRVAVPGTGTEHVTTIDLFDTCNDYGTNVTVGPDGSVSSQTFTTAMDCEPTPTETPDPGTPSSEEFALGETTGDVNPHGLTVRNDGGDPQTGRLRVTDADTGETLLDRSFSLGDGESIGGDLRGPATYEVRVTVSGAGTEHRTTVEYFDTCNTYGTTVTIDADGSMTSETVRTLVACDPGTPSVDGFALGETTGDVNPHELTVYNGDSVTRTVDLRVVETDTGETLLDRSFSLGAGGDVSGELRGPATYEVRVAVPAAGTGDVTTVEYFDTCNDYGTHVTIDSGGSVSMEAFRTDALCDSG